MTTLRGVDARNFDDVAPERRGRIATRRVTGDGWGVTQVEFGVGARWQIDAGRLVGADWCDEPHRVVVLRGTLDIELRSGERRTLRAGDVAEIPPGHDALTGGPYPCVFLEIDGFGG